MKSIDYFSPYQIRINRILDQYLPSPSIEPQMLHQAMRYAVLNGGKRLRPLLVYATGETLGASLHQLDSAACAVELIHAFSLVHDDLPAMDNDDMRRGFPTCHKAFDEATAILAGDALQTLAFEILANEATEELTSQQKLRLIQILSKATSSLGMAGGQALEFAYVNKKIAVEDLKQVHRLKTGALMRASVELGAIVANADASVIKELDQYADLIGLAYQIQDDIDDGMPDGNKVTYLSFLGLATAQKELADLYQQAQIKLKAFGEKAKPLLMLTDYMLQNYKV